MRFRSPSHLFLGPVLTALAIAVGGAPVSAIAVEDGRAFELLVSNGSPIGTAAFPTARTDTHSLAFLALSVTELEWANESCELPDDPNADVPDCWWEIGWFVAEATICLAAIGIPAFKLAKMGRKAKKAADAAKKKGMPFGEAVAHVGSVIFGVFICAEAWSSMKEMAECLWRN